MWVDGGRRGNASRAHYQHWVLPDVPWSYTRPPQKAIVRTMYTIQKHLEVSRLWIYWFGFFLKSFPQSHVRKLIVLLTVKESAFACLPCVMSTGLVFQNSFKSFCHKMGEVTNESSRYCKSFNYSCLHSIAKAKQSVYRGLAA